MNVSICGINCTKCELRASCGGCIKTNGHPFGGECVVALCCRNNGRDNCGECTYDSCRLREQLILEFNALGIKDMVKITGLNALKGTYINIEYTLENGQKFKLLEDNKIYLGNQISKTGSERYYGLAADEKYILVCEYGVGGSDAEIITYRKRNL